MRWGGCRGSTSPLHLSERRRGRRTPHLPLLPLIPLLPPVLFPCRQRTRPLHHPLPPLPSQPPHRHLRRGGRRGRRRRMRGRRSRESSRRGERRRDPNKERVRRGVKVNSKGHPFSLLPPLLTPVPSRLHPNPLWGRGGGGWGSQSGGREKGLRTKGRDWHLLTHERF